MGSSESTPRTLTVEQDEDSDALKLSETRKLGSSDGSSSSDNTEGKTHDDEFSRAQALYANKIHHLQNKNEQIFRTSLDELATAVQDVEHKYMKTSGATVCADLQESIMRCYLANQKTSLNCAAEVREYSHCVNEHRKKMLAK